MYQNKHIVDDKDIRHRIIAAANRHPQSRAAKLILEFEETPHVVTLVLLMEEISNHAVYNVDYDIPLRYYLARLEEFMKDKESLSLNESSKILEHSSKIYGRRVDSLYDRVNQLVSNLVQSDNEFQTAKKMGPTENSAVNAGTVKSVEKPKRQRKRHDDMIVDHYEAHMEVKKFKTIAHEKLYAEPKDEWVAKNSHAYMDEDHMNVALWRHAHVIDTHNSDDKDPMRNYKLFTYVFDHRYYMPVSDTNYRLLFDVRDFLEAENIDVDYDMESSDDDGSEENSLQLTTDNQQTNEISSPRKKRKMTRHQEYMQRTLSLEDKFFRQRLEVLTGNKTDETGRKRLNVETEDEAIKLPRINVEKLMSSTQLVTSSLEGHNSAQQHADSAIGNSFQQSQCEDSLAVLCNSMEQSKETNTDTAVGDSLQQNDSQNSTASLSNSLEQCQQTDGDISEQISIQRESQQSMDTTQISNADSAFSDSLIDKQQSSDSVFNNLQAIDAEESQNFTNHEDTFNATNVLESTRLESDIQNNTSVSDFAALNNSTVSNDNHKDAFDDYISQHVDEGVVLSDEENNLRLSPVLHMKDKSVVRPNDVQPSLTEEDELSIRLDMVQDNTEELCLVSAEVRRPIVPIKINLLKINEKMLRKKVLFKLGKEFKLFMLQRSLKRTRGELEQQEPKRHKLIQLSNSEDDDTNSGAYSPTSERDEFEYYGGFLGFDRRRDSGMSDVDFETTYEFETENQHTIDEAFKTIESMDCGNKVCGLVKNSVQTEIQNRNETSNVPVVEENATVDEVTSSVAKTSITDESTVQTNDEATLMQPNNGNVAEGNLEDEDLSIVNDFSVQTQLMSQIDTNDNNLHDMDSDEDDEDTDETRRKIRDWHHQIAPSLAAAHSRQHFSVFDIGSEIINKVSATNNKQLSLNDLMAGKNPTHLSRVFLSLLMLTNQNNVELDAGKRNAERPTDLNELKITLKSIERHEVHFEDDIGASGHIVPVTSTPAATAKSKPEIVNNKNRSKRYSNADKYVNIDSTTTTVHVLQRIPKSSIYVDNDNDSGISSFVSTNNSSR